MNETTRREFLKDAVLAGAAITTCTLAEGNLFATGLPVPKTVSRAVDPSPGSSPSVKLSWLGGDPPPVPAGVSWGVPWPQGAIERGSSFNLSESGKELPVQTWPLAYWPDGSVKWSGFATVVPAGVAGPFLLSGGSSAAAAGLKVTNDGNSILVDTGVLQCSIPLGGRANLVDSMTVAGRAVAGAVRLVCILQNGPESSADEAQPREKYAGMVKKVTVEQSGPVRALVNFEGVHKSVKSGREWLPFQVRLYFYAGESSVRMVHTILFDGDQQKDFIHGLGVTFAVPLREEVQNRHVRFSGEGDGLWSEPIQPLIGRAGQQRIVIDANGKDVYPAQLAALRVPNRSQMNRQGLNMVNNWAVWDDFKLVQLSPDGFTIQKRTNPQSTWLFSAAGKRSSGMAFVGDASGGLGVSVKNFWQSYPTEMQVENASSPVALLTAWIWSPEAAPMDLRHYDTRAHGLEAAYEDVQPGNSTPFGIARTSELSLWPTDGVPAKSTSAAMAKTGSAQPVLVASPQYYHDVRSVCGACAIPRPRSRWRSRTRSTPRSTSMSARSTSATGMGSGTMAT